MCHENKLLTGGSAAQYLVAWSVVEYLLYTYLVFTTCTALYPPPPPSRGIRSLMRASRRPANLALFTKLGQRARMRNEIGSSRTGGWFRMRVCFGCFFFPCFRISSREEREVVSFYLVGAVKIRSEMERSKSICYVINNLWWREKNRRFMRLMSFRKAWN